MRFLRFCIVKCIFHHGHIFENLFPCFSEISNSAKHFIKVIVIVAHNAWWSWSSPSAAIWIGMRPHKLGRGCQSLPIISRFMSLYRLFFLSVLVPCFQRKDLTEFFSWKGTLWKSLICNFSWVSRSFFLILYLTCPRTVTVIYLIDPNEFSEFMRTMYTRKIGKVCSTLKK